MKIRKCGTCRFFNDTAKHSHCRRWPPHSLSNTESTFPLVPEWSWACGEYRYSLARIAGAIRRLLRGANPTHSVASGVAGDNPDNPAVG